MNRITDLNDTLELYRIAKNDKYTIGRLFYQGGYICDTLEPPVRDKYILGCSAVPPDSYTLSVDVYSPKFKMNCPRIIDFSLSRNILIHVGNSITDTEGCILVGFNRARGLLSSSKACFDYLYQRIKYKHTLLLKIE